MLEKYLQKLGITEFSQLSKEEKETYRRWEEALQGRRLTDQDVDSFLFQELDSAIIKLTSQKLNDREDTFLKMKVEFIRSVRSFLKLPQLERAMVEREIGGLIEKL